MIDKYENLSLGEERALYGISNAKVKNCVFAGEADGESALKETSHLSIDGCEFRLRYPMWHMSHSAVENSVLTDTCRAPLWYDDEIRLSACTINGTKALRECDRVTMEGCDVNSDEFGWFCRNLIWTNGKLKSQYPFLKSTDMELSQFELNGKYSFQYVENTRIIDSVLNTKDAFWHSKNVTVINSVVNGEYLGWYSENLKLVRCRIEGTQPLCYAHGLVLENCTMTGCDLSFEKSEVDATVIGGIDSVKNPESGRITASSVGEVISEDGRERRTELTVDGGLSRMI